MTLVIILLFLILLCVMPRGVWSGMGRGIQLIAVGAFILYEIDRRGPGIRAGLESFDWMPALLGTLLVLVIGCVVAFIRGLVNLPPPGQR
jgi:hypothetical protein